MNIYINITIISILLLGINSEFSFSLSSGSWTYEVTKDEFTEQIKVVGICYSKQTAKAWLNETEPYLVARCQENKTELYLNLGSAFNVEHGHYNEAKIRYIIDSGKPVTQYWGESTDNKAAFSPKPIGLIRKLTKANKIKIQVIPFNSDPQVLEFDLTGFSKVSKEISKACNWKL